MFDDVFETFIVFREKERLQKFSGQLAKRFIRRRKYRVTGMHVLEKFALSTCGDSTRENFKAAVFLKSLEQVIRCRHEDIVDQIDDTI